MKVTAAGHSELRHSAGRICTFRCGICWSSFLQLSFVFPYEKQNLTCKYLTLKCTHTFNVQIPCFILEVVLTNTSLFCHIDNYRAKQSNSFIANNANC